MCAFVFVGRVLVLVLTMMIACRQSVALVIVLGLLLVLVPISLLDVFVFFGVVAIPLFVCSLVSAVPSLSCGCAGYRCSHLNTFVDFRTVVIAI